MKRIQVDLLIEGDESVEDIAEMCDLTVSELLEFNPVLRRWFSRDYQMPRHAQVTIKVCRFSDYPSVHLVVF